MGDFLLIQFKREHKVMEPAMNYNGHTFLENIKNRIDISIWTENVYYSGLFFVKNHDRYTSFLFLTGHDVI